MPAIPLRTSIIPLLHIENLIPYPILAPRAHPPQNWVKVLAAISMTGRDAGFFASEPEGFAADFMLTARGGLRLNWLKKVTLPLDLKTCRFDNWGFSIVRQTRLGEKREETLF